MIQSHFCNRTFNIVFWKVGGLLCYYLSTLTIVLFLSSWSKYTDQNSIHQLVLFCKNLNFYEIEVENHQTLHWSKIRLDLKSKAKYLSVAFARQQLKVHTQEICFMCACILTDPNSKFQLNQNIKKIVKPSSSIKLL